MGTRAIIIKRLGLRYALDIQRWNTNPTVQVLSSIFGQDCVSFFRFNYKSLQTLFFLFLIRVCNFRAFVSQHSPYLNKRDFKDPPETRRLVRTLPHVSFALRTSTIFSANHSTLHRLTMGRFESLVKTSALIELFKKKYHIPQEVVVRHCTTKGVEFDRKVGEVVISMIAFIE